MSRLHVASDQSPLAVFNDMRDVIKKVELVTEVRTQERKQTTEVLA